ncbi:hypothetical protein RRG08_030693 [Elysia crispata]|uniref:Kringle domain-containing protein n=1 Tax=Elysia crispata TaxID=231223 RepID=A0AAE0Y4R1_9GAST|nr:hypothetical protein RRG08_030693 [Elysia crispata]
MSLGITFSYVKKILLLTTYFGLFKHACAMTPLSFTAVSSRKILDTGGCPGMYVDSAAACAMQCFLNTWCRVYVIGLCDWESPNPCYCVVCQMDPIIDQVTPGKSSVGMFRLVLIPKISTPKRLVPSNNCGGLQWTSVSTSCVGSVGAITSSLSASPILALRVSEVLVAFGGTRYRASPVCPPTFTPRGQVECHSTEGIWHNHNSLACFPLECYQQHGDKQYYAGYKNVTKSGRPCWTWQYQGPFSNNLIGHPYPFDNNDIVQAKNYCRCFFTEDYGHLWCYNGNYDSVSDPLRWEDCSVPECFAVY